MNILVTGGAGFIGSNFIEHIINKKKVRKVINLDCLSYAGSVKNTKEFQHHEKYFFEKVNLKNFYKILKVFEKHDITHVIHLAAETHVDNSIVSPDEFIKSNIIGTFNLLKASLPFRVKRFHHVSTDEVYGQLGKTGKFKESSPYAPRNPYSATKAGSDFLVKAYTHTYDLPATISNCCNNYGPRQHKEKFIPTVIDSLFNEHKIPVYGKGDNVRDWIYVEDHCRALWTILIKGKIGETYLVGADCERTNLQTIKEICKLMKMKPKDYIEFVKDRAAHDFRYAIDGSKTSKELGWKPNTPFERGLKKTITWYEKKY